MSACGSDWSGWCFSPSSGHPLCAALLLFRSPGQPDLIPLCVPMQNCQTLLSWICPALRGQALVTETVEFMFL